MTGSFSRGLAAGAAGTTVLNAVTYLDMAVRGRAASSTPDQTVDALADATGQQIPGKRSVRDNRRTALGALAGIGNGVAVGVLASLARSSGVRLLPGIPPVAIRLRRNNISNVHDVPFNGSRIDADQGRLLGSIIPRRCGCSLRIAAHLPGGPGGGLGLGGGLLRI